MLLIYLMEKGRSQKNSSLSQKFVHPLPQHWLIEMSAKQGNRQMTPGLSFYIWVYNYTCTINETKANQSNNQMWQYWFKKKTCHYRVCCSPQAPLVHWDVPVGPEVCDSLRVPEIKSSLRNWCQNCSAIWINIPRKTLFETYVIHHLLHLETPSLLLHLTDCYNNILK